ncbi:MAG: helix-turn-helix domain-containing protein [Candidatus Bathyarchaeota archaeon]|nr:helix-turn-helix domain-containing protein [Candidatus Bathyarchaeota archaeon]
MNSDQELDGTTLRIYVALANSDKPLGPREVTRLAQLSSPSVAYRNLQKLEELGLVEKDAFGEYTIKQKQRVKGHLWVGSRLFPRLLFYAFFFIGILSVETIIAGLRLLESEPLQYDFILLIVVTATSTVLFLLEGILSNRFERKKQPIQHDATSEGV